MTRSIDRLFIRPLFYDALSGEFTPPGGTKTHTLARLAIATYIKGEADTENTEENPHKLFRYTPSWAPSVESSVICRTDRRADYTTLGLISVDAQGGGLTLLDGVVDSNHGTHGLVITNSVGTARNMLELGEPLDEMREIVSKAAQRFFDVALRQ